MNRSVNTKQYALAHKSRALDLANEQKKSADLVVSNWEMAQRIRELEAQFAASSPSSKKPKASRHSICIAARAPLDDTENIAKYDTNDSGPGVIVCVDNGSSEEEEFDDDYIVSKPTSTEFYAAFPPPNPSKTSPLATGADKGRVSDGGI
jgi:hypothetical protein